MLLSLKEEKIDENFWMKKKAEVKTENTLIFYDFCHVHG